MIQLLVSTIWVTSWTTYFITIFYALGNNDYDSGPYTVNFIAENTDASFNVTIKDHDELESIEIFYLSINTSTLPHNIDISNPSQATVIISDDDCK